MASSLHYHISFKYDSLFIKIEEAGSRRVLYYDTLMALASPSDQEIIAFLKKMHTRFSRMSNTLSFQVVEVALPDAPEALRLLGKTGRVFYQAKPFQCDWDTKAKIYWKGQRDQFAAYVQYKTEQVPLEACEKVFPSWCIWKAIAFPLDISLSWRWVELFFKGPIVLEGVKKKRFLEEDPLIVWSEDSSKAQLFLTDAAGCFANLGKESSIWEKDLLEAGFIRKIVGNSSYFCPTDHLFATLSLLLEVGWEIFVASGKRLLKQTSSEWNLREQSTMITVCGQVQFQDKKGSLRASMEAYQKGKLWIDIDETSVGLLDKRKGETLEGRWVGEELHIQREHTSCLIPFLDQEGVKWEDSLLQVVKGLKEGGSMETTLPGASFQGELLTHQQKGLDWLNFLYRWGFSALLADEMGLGKTVQVLAFFSRLRTNLPILIVAPTSLIFNWRSEMDRFLKQPSIYLHTGPDRITQASDLQKYPFVITSYAILRLDEELLSQVQWEVIVLDESGAIKTATTQTAQAAYRLKGRFRICLSGTPIENRSEELWSQFKFLLPHLTFQGGMQSRKVKPFILRRRKDELDLPEKIEQIAWVEMNDEQSSIYHSYLEGVRTGLLKKVAIDGTSSHRMEILEAILRLRQICDDPRLIGQECGGAKLEQILSDIEQALFEKRKVLIYSQFTSMLTLIAKELTTDFLYMDGSVSAQERAERVRRFQQDPEASLFLLSLKAGGVGLNLTAADYVFMVDPWWNDAVENQAIDRAHRIGRKNTVIAKRYLTPGTIEEKMLSLKAKKLEVAASLLDPTADFSWTEEDLLHLLS